MGQIISYCNCSRQSPSRLLSRISRLKNDPSQQNLMVKKLLFHQIADVFPYKYLGKGLYGTTVQVYVKEDKKAKFAQKIIPQQNLTENYICYDPETVDRIMLDPVLKHKIVKVHAYSINNQKRKMYLIMDLMKKSDLYFHVCLVQKKNGRIFNEITIKRVAMELLDIVERFHEHNVIFRNLRSENIFVKDNGKLAVSDFFFAINGNRSHTYYGAAEYAPPQVYYMQKTIKTINQGMMRNLNQISDATEDKQLRLSPDIRRYNINTNQSTFFKMTKSCDLKDQIQQLKLKKKQQKQYQSQKQKSQQISILKVKRVDSKQSQQKQSEDLPPPRKSLRHLTTLNLPSRANHNKQKHLTYVIPEEPFGQNSQVKEDTIRVGPGFFKVQFQSNRLDTQGDVDSNTSSTGNGRAYDKSVDIWMLGVLLFELIFGRTPFQKWKGTCDVLSKTPACPSYAENLIDLENQVKYKQIHDIWPSINMQNSQVIISPVQRDFIQSLLIRQTQKRKSIIDLKKHLFLSDCDLETPIQNLIYEQAFDSTAFQKDIKYFIKHKDSGLVANRTVLRKTCKTNEVHARITEKLFQHERSVYQG